MENFKVDVRFPGRESDNPDLVVITGQEDNVLECKDDLLNRAEELVRMNSEHTMLFTTSHLFTQSNILFHSLGTDKRCFNLFIFIQ